MANVNLVNIQKNFGNLEVIKKVDLTLQSGEFIVFVGPSGCGKSTLLRMVAGLEQPTGGNIYIDGKPVNHLSPKERGVAMVFQNYALYPHMSVEQNIGFSLKLSKVPKQEIKRSVLEAAQILQIEPLLKKKPGQLSGGQKQRVAMGRAMVRKPKVFLFDEPLSNLDAQLRVQMRSEIALLHRKLKSTVIYVTHDQAEAMTLADRIVILNGGYIEQVGPPLEVYRHPDTKFVASFIGTPSMNFLPKQSVAIPTPMDAANTIGFRPEKTTLDTNGSKDSVCLGKGNVELIEPLGTNAHVHIALGEHRVVAETLTEAAPETGQEVPLWVNPKSLFFFDKQGQTIAGAGSEH